MVSCNIACPKRNWRDVIQNVPKETGSVLFIFFGNRSDTGGRPMSEICNFMFRPEHSRGEPMVKEKEVLFIKCSFKTF